MTALGVYNLAQACYNYIYLATDFTVEMRVKMSMEDWSLNQFLGIRASSPITHRTQLFRQPTIFKSVPGVPNV